ncbi:alpha-L-glutamate ligase-like protein [Orrella sp. 11846]|uniref:alpha-L-glutamate ligase-like protein n=1 Tax=Orrella sp. 11846 TaxID=3409913 RepID=UPI003B5A9A73
MVGLLKTWRDLRRKGVMGINQRNADYILKYNQRQFFPLVDNKVLTKERARARGIHVPQAYAVVRTEREIAKIFEIIDAHDDFVIKPAHGAAGEGIVVISDRFDDLYRTVSGRLLSRNDLSHHLSNILTGMYSLGGAPDQALIEYRVKSDPIFERISYSGVPDIRIIVLLGYPVMAMVRLPTQQSQGKANLHQGAIGVGIDLAKGCTLQGSWMNRRITHHPDTRNMVDGVAVKHWDALLHQAASCYEMCHLGYIGVDMVLDKEHGPMMLEVNARPGLNIQIANNAGLAARCLQVEEQIRMLKKQGAEENVQDRVRFSQSLMD